MKLCLFQKIKTKAEEKKNKKLNLKQIINLKEIMM